MTDSDEEQGRLSRLRARSIAPDENRGGACDVRRTRALFRGRILRDCGAGPSLPEDEPADASEIYRGADEALSTERSSNPQNVLRSPGGSARRRLERRSMGSGGRLDRIVGTL